MNLDNKNNEGNGLPEGVRRALAGKNQALTPGEIARIKKEVDDGKVVPEGGVPPDREEDRDYVNNPPSERL